MTKIATHNCTSSSSERSQTRRRPSRALQFFFKIPAAAHRDQFYYFSFRVQHVLPPTAQTNRQNNNNIYFFQSSVANGFAILNFSPTVARRQAGAHSVFPCNILLYYNNYYILHSCGITFYVLSSLTARTTFAIRGCHTHVCPSVKTEFHADEPRWTETTVIAGVSRI